jgi:oxygen-dependent protoporphyrinogen oxidase
VIDQSDRPGGKLRTGAVTGVDGSPVPVELGAESFLARDPATGGESAAVRLARRLGLGGDLVHPATRGAALAVDRTLRPLPGGTLMGVPARLELLDGVAKPAAGRDTDDGRPLLAPGQDTAVGELVRARLGDQVVDRLVDPLLGGVYAGRADLLSLAATMPGLAAAAACEHTLTGAVRAALAASAAHRPAPGSPADAGCASGRVGGCRNRPQPALPVFATVAGGVERLVRAAVAQVPVQLGQPVRELRRTGSRWTLVLGPVPRPQVVEADGVVLAVPARPAARLLAGVAPAAAADVGALDYASVALVAFALPAARLPEMSGFLVPAGEGFDVKAVTFFTGKWPHLRRADGTVLIRASLGRYGEEQVLQRDDASLTKHVLSELSTLLDRRLPDPVDSLVQRWGGALPQYAPGHLDRVARARSALRGGGTGSPLLPLALAGAAYDGVGIPACVRSGEAAADEIVAALSGPPLRSASG